jgi:periplasmic divalent cation tolerance protein
MADDHLFVYVTFPTLKEAEKVSNAVVKERLAACANIMPTHKAVYRWKGKLERAKEVAVVFKTFHTRFEKLKNRIVKLHSYDVPCVAALEIEKGNKPFLDWIEAETRPARKKRKKKPAKTTKRKKR